MKIEIIEPYEVLGYTIKGMNVTDSDGTRIYIHEGYGTPDQPYRIAASEISPVVAGRIFFNMANQNP